MTRVRSFWRLTGTALAALTVWVVASLAWPRRVDLRSFDPVEVGRAETAMWRSYYEKRPVRLFWQLASDLRAQFHTGFARSVASAYRASKAAFVFKDGRSRADYMRALPDLQRYYASIDDIAAERFDASVVARTELEWWIIRRERDRHTMDEWAQLIATEGAEMYHVPAAQLADYARLRVEAMVLRDEKGAGITEEDWRTIAGILERSWQALSRAIAPASVARRGA
jgi:hypothetical protein